MSSNSEISARPNLIQNLPSSQEDWEIYIDSIERDFRSGLNIAQKQDKLNNFLNHFASSKASVLMLSSMIKNRKQNAYSPLLIDTLVVHPSFSNGALSIEMAHPNHYLFSLLYNLASLSTQLNETKAEENKIYYKNLYNVALSISKYAPLNGARIEHSGMRPMEYFAKELKEKNISLSQFNDLLIYFFMSNPQELKGSNSLGYQVETYLGTKTLASLQEAMMRQQRPAHPVLYFNKSSAENASLDPAQTSALQSHTVSLPFFSRLMHAITGNIFLNSSLQELAKSANYLSNVKEVEQSLAAPILPPQSLSSLVGENYIKSKSSLAQVEKMDFESKTILLEKLNLALDSYTDLFIISEPLLENRTDVLFYIKKQFATNFNSSVDAFIKISQSTNELSEINSASLMLLDNINLIIEKTASLQAALTQEAKNVAITQLQVEHKYLHKNQKPSLKV